MWECRLAPAQPGPAVRPAVRSAAHAALVTLVIPADDVQSLVLPGVQTHGRCAFLGDARESLTSGSQAAPLCASSEQRGGFVFPRVVWEDVEFSLVVCCVGAAAVRQGR